MFNPIKAASNFAKGVGDLNAMRKQAAIIQAALEKEEFDVKACRGGRPGQRNPEARHQ